MSCLLLYLGFRMIRLRKLLFVCALYTYYICPELPRTILKSQATPQVETDNSKKE